MKTVGQIFLLVFLDILCLSYATTVCRDVKVCNPVVQIFNNVFEFQVENISISLFEGSLVMVLQDGIGFDAFCGDEVGVVMDRDENPIAKFSRRSQDIHLDVDICEKHSFQLIVMEYSFPTKVTRSPWTSYHPMEWFVVYPAVLPSHTVLWHKGVVLVEWWKNIVLSEDYLECLIYVDFLTEDGTMLHSVLNTEELVPVELKLDLCTVERLEVKYTLVGVDGTRKRFSKVLHISAGLLAPQQFDLKLINGTIVMESDVSLRCFSVDLLMHKNGTILYSKKNLDLENTNEVRITNFTTEDFCGNLTIDSRLQNKANGSQNYHFSQVLELRCPVVLRAGLSRDSALEVLGVIIGVTLCAVTGLTCAIVIRLRHKVKILFPQ